MADNFDSGFEQYERVEAEYRRNLAVLERQGDESARRELWRRFFLARDRWRRCDEVALIGGCTIRLIAHAEGAVKVRVGSGFLA